MEPSSVPLRLRPSLISVPRYQTGASQKRDESQELYSRSA